MPEGSTNNGEVTALLGTNGSKPGPSFFQQSRGQVPSWGSTVRNEGYGVRNPFLAPLLKPVKVGTTDWYRKVREMRKHPTVRLARVLAISVMADAPWSVEAEDEAPEGAKEFIEKQFLPWHDTLMDVSLRGCHDFGWQPWEKIFRYNIDSMQIEIGKFKPLLQDQTEIVIQSDTGSFAGLRQFQLYLETPNVLVISQDVEGTDFYGEGAMPSIEVAFNRWLVADDANTRFDKKVSGSHWVIHYPVGNSEVNGKLVDNHDVAMEMLNRLEGSGSIIVPNDIQAIVTDLNNKSLDTMWKIEILAADAGQQVGFQQRLSYLDSLLVRGSEFPERSILEGQYGTKAEAEAHADFAVSRMDWRNKQVVNQINWHSVNQLLGLNYGHKAVNTVRLKCSPIADDKIAMLKQVYTTALSNPAISTGEFQQIDMQAVRDQVGVPTLQHSGDMSGNPGPDYTGGTGLNGGSDPMLQQFLAHLNAPDSPNSQPPQQVPQQIGSTA